MTVAVATGGKVTSKRVCQNCPILVGSKVYHIDFVSAPVHPRVLIIVKTHENRVEHILAMLQMT